MKLIPEAREDVTIEWLSKALHHMNLDVVNFQWKGSVGVGLGMLSCLERITIFYRVRGDSPDFPLRALNVVMKTLPQSEHLIKLIITEGMANREYQFYDKVIPAWSQFMDQRNVAKEHRFRFPECYFRAKSGEGMDFKMVLLLEDLDDEEFVMWKGGYSRGLGKRATRAALKQLALFHAIGIAYKEAVLPSNETYYKIFPFLAGEPVNKECVAGFLKKGAEETIKRIIDEDEENAPPGLKYDLQQLGTVEQIERLPSALLPTPYDTITHHDLHANNLMFRDNSLHSRRKEAVLLDFQCCSYSNPMKDVTFLLFLSCRPQYFLNKDRLDILLKYYHKVMNIALQAMGSQIRYSIWQIKKDFTQFSTISIIHILMGSVSWSFGTGTNQNTRNRLKAALYDTYRITGSLSI